MSLGSAVSVRAPGAPAAPACATGAADDGAYGDRDRSRALPLSAGAVDEGVGAVANVELVARGSVTAISGRPGPAALRPEENGINGNGASSARV